MKGRIVNYRGGVRTQYTNQMVVVPDDSKNRGDAGKLAGKTVVWKTPSGREIRGEVKRPHGGRGQVLVHFERGLPGQALGTEVEIL